MDEIMQDSNLHFLIEQFKRDVKAGVYDGYKIDGGMLCNDLLEPFINLDNPKFKKVDKIILVNMENDYVLPEYIFNYYNKEDIIVISPDIKNNFSDVLNFKNEFCTDMYNRGYEIAKEKNWGANHSSSSEIPELLEMLSAFLISLGNKS